MELKEPFFPLIPDSVDPEIPSLVFDDPPPIYSLLDPLSEDAIALAPATEQEDIRRICKTHKETLASLRRSVMTNRAAYERQSKFRAKHAASSRNPTTEHAELDAAVAELEQVERELEAVRSAEAKFEALLESQTYSPLGLIKHLAKEITIVNRLRCLEDPPLYLFIAPTEGSEGNISFSKEQSRILLLEPGNCTLVNLCKALEDYEALKLGPGHP
jgi:hypothetical protein